MSTVLLNGASSPADPAQALCTEVERPLAAPFETVRTFRLAGCDIGYYMGGFDCFVKTPCRCRIPDEGQEIERAVHDAERLMRVTPLHFGGYAAPLKKAVDRLLPLISPFFRKAGDRTHHALRYQRRARWAALACDETPSLERARLAVFEWSNGKQTIMLRPGDTLLEAALNAGIALLFSCCSGGCGACRVHITGQLDHVVLDEPNTVMPEDRSRGEVPVCLVRLSVPCRFRLP